MRLTFCAALALAAAMPAIAAVPDPVVNGRIIDAGMNHGDVMETVAYLTDRIGGRMTNSPQMRAAENWTRQRFAEYGLSNARLEPFEFGQGWSIDSSQVRMTAPRVLTLRSIPVAWTPGTGGAVTAPIVVAPLRRDRDFAKWRGKLAGKIVLVSMPGEADEPKDAAFERYDSPAITKLDVFDQPKTSAADLAKTIRRDGFGARRDAFLAAEGAKAWVSKSYRDGGLISGEGEGYAAGDARRVPGIQMAAEDYRRLARLAKGSEPVALEIDTRVTFHSADTRANNVIADLPGRDPKAGYVMAGAHLDSWVGADGATDNAAGSAVVMEAARILAGLGVKPKRAIRFALWSGEEQGLYGSIAYLVQHLVTRAPITDPALAKVNPYYTWPTRYPITPKSEFNELAAYFNLDNGSGKIRGIYAEGNPAVAATFTQWLAPFAGMGADAVVSSRTTGTDHVFMQSVGLPGFQFIQDPLDYETRTHHSDVDTFDHLKAADLRQASVIMASFLWNAANADAPLPRPPLPTRPKETDPFAYVDDEE
ncbi:peptidase M28 [Polymorphobacter glacialis]|uniref:Carboxypeptidase Q n=1 Tax=Sandarakinorhabdus glacialis TaxID=1614636 RepID=A0A916ZNK3_9SPHN|nr:M20/M25/M40 family metallo-hydrolase [Polymorphobacter glacialis]GGE06257.1 peptidase M28 [Polymorphobacter glacialis]